jgi:hypothetical protein
MAGTRCSSPSPGAGCGFDGYRIRRPGWQVSACTDAPQGRPTHRRYPVHERSHRGDRSYGCSRREPLRKPAAARSKVMRGLSSHIARTWRNATYLEARRPADANHPCAVCVRKRTLPGPIEPPPSSCGLFQGRRSQRRRPSIPHNLRGRCTWIPAGRAMKGALPLCLFVLSVCAPIFAQPAGGPPQNPPVPVNMAEIVTLVRNRNLLVKASQEGIRTAEARVAQAEALRLGENQRRRLVPAPQRPNRHLLPARSRSPLWRDDPGSPACCDRSNRPVARTP